MRMRALTSLSRSVLARTQPILCHLRRGNDVRPRPVASPALARFPAPPTLSSSALSRPLRSDRTVEFTMHLCRNAWLKLAPVTQRGAAALLRTASARQMSSSVPGSSGEALPYYLLVGVALAGGGFYAYRTVSRDRARFNDRHEYINTQLKPAFEDYESKK